MWETISYHKNKIFAILLIIAIFYGMYVPDEDFDDPYTISVDYDCKEIVRDPSDIPKDIVQQCNDLIEELEKQNEPRPNKSTT